MNRLAIGAVLCAMTFVASEAAFADEGLIRLRATASRNSYSLGFDQNAGTGYKNKTAKATYTMKGVGLTAVSSSGVYLDIVTAKSGSATHDLWSNFTSTPQSFERKESAITLGFSSQVGEGSASGFLGYKTGESDLNAPPGALGAYTFTKDKFKSSGMFFGGGFAFPAMGGNLGFNGAIALMSGKWTDDHNPPYDNSADTTVGFSLGASYTYLFTKNVGMSVDWKFNAYSYNFALYSTTQPAYTVTETINSFGVNLLAQF
jgi:hypothetical protein